MIPKVIHYVWVGQKSMGPLQKRCVASWRKYLLDYEFHLWNESNLPPEVMNHPYVQHMYRAGKWAFVSDFIRFWVLNREGGIYLDTDTEVLKSFEPLLQHNAFFGKTKDGFVAAGVIGATPGQRVIKDILRVYETDTEFNIKRTSPRTITQVLKEGNYPEVKVFDYQYFNPCDDGEVCPPEKLANAYTNNHWAESWVPFAGLRKLFRRAGIMPFVKAWYAPKN